MAVRLRMTRFGTKKKPYFRIVAAHGEKPRDGRFLEVIGNYDPRKVSNKATFNKEKLEYWLSKGATSSDTVSKLIRDCK